MMEKMPERKDDILRKIIKKEMLEAAPASFTGNVMAKLGLETAKPMYNYKPVISKNGWVLIGILTLLVYLFLFMTGSSTDSVSASLETKIFRDYFEHALSSLMSGSIAIYITIASIAVFLLFLVESIYRQSRLRTFQI